MVYSMVLEKFIRNSCRHFCGFSKLELSGYYFSHYLRIESTTSSTNTPYRQDTITHVMYGIGENVSHGKWIKKSCIEKYDTTCVVWLWNLHTGSSFTLNLPSIIFLSFYIYRHTFSQWKFYYQTNDFLALFFLFFLLLIAIITNRIFVAIFHSHTNTRSIIKMPNFFSLFINRKKS